MTESTTAGVMAEMPRYQCHKKVWALKIKSLVNDSKIQGAAIFTPQEDGFAPIHLDPAFMERHKPEVGGYFVVYEDGYRSFSPTKAFEDGYSIDARDHLRRLAEKLPQTEFQPTPFV